MARMNFHTSVALVALLGASAALVTACDKAKEEAVDAAAPATSGTPAAVDAAMAIADAAPADGGTAEEARSRPLSRGPGAALFAAARGLKLAPEQAKKVDEADKLAAPAPDNTPREAAKDLHAEIVAGIRAGKMDTTKLEPKYAALEKTSVAEHDKSVASLNALHAALEPAQRKEVAAAVRANQAKREEKMAKREAKGDGGHAANAPNAKRSFEHLTRGLDLDADQQKKVDALAAKDDAKEGFDPAAMKKRMETLLAAFEKDTFDAKKSDGFEMKKNRAVVEDETKRVSLLLPILKPEQREKLAARMEKGPSPHGGKHSPGNMGHRPLLEQDDDETN